MSDGDLLDRTLRLAESEAAASPELRGQIEALLEGVRELAWSVPDGDLERLAQTVDALEAARRGQQPSRPWWRRWR